MFFLQIMVSRYRYLFAIDLLNLHTVLPVSTGTVNTVNGYKSFWKVQRTVLQKVHNSLYWMTDLLVTSGTGTCPNIFLQPVANSRNICIANWLPSPESNHFFSNSVSVGFFLHEEIVFISAVLRSLNSFTRLRLQIFFFRLRLLVKYFGSVST